MKRLVIAALVLVVGLGGGAWAYRNFVLLPEARRQAVSDLSDPDSALFRNERMVSPWSTDVMFYCAEINTKNRMGGYVGYQYTVVDPSKKPNHFENWDGTSVCDYRAEGAPWWWLTR